MINPKFLKRYSTYANGAMLAASTVLAILPQVQLDPNVLIGLTIAGNLVIGVCQAIKQEGAK